MSRIKISNKLKSSNRDNRDNRDDRDDRDDRYDRDGRDDKDDRDDRDNYFHRSYEEQTPSYLQSQRELQSQPYSYPRSQLQTLKKKPNIFGVKKELIHKYNEKYKNKSDEEIVEDIIPEDMMVQYKRELQFLDKIIKLFPELKKKKKYIIEELLVPKKNYEIEHVVEKITINEKSYYKDKYKHIFDENVNLVGMWEYSDNSVDKIDYYIFLDNLNNLKNKIISSKRQFYEFNMNNMNNMNNDIFESKKNDS